MPILPSSQLEKLERDCSLILENNKITFVGVINSLGNLIAGGFGEGVVPPGTKEIQKMMYMQLKLDLSMRKDYDGLYGPVTYVVSKRSNVEKISIPIGNYMILLITEPNFDYDSKVEEITPIFKSSLDGYT
jgi:hypothetical protein